MQTIDVKLRFCEAVSDLQSIGFHISHLFDKIFKIIH